jgi:hypothetical protein
MASAVVRRTFLVASSCALVAAVNQPPVARDAPVAASSAPAASWYRRSRALDITGANARDSIVLTATGKRADSLSVTMTFFVGGAAIHRQRWSSEDELYDTEALRGKPNHLERLMRTRLDTALALVKRQPINREQVKHMGDETALRKIVPRPTHQIMLSFGFENSLFLAWDPARRTLVTFMECC